MKYELKNFDRTILISDDWTTILKLSDHYEKNNISVSIKNIFNGAFEEHINKLIDEQMKIIEKQIEYELLYGDVSK